MSAGERESGHASIDDLAAFLNGGLSAASRRLIAGHLDRCDQCRHELAVAASTLLEHESPKRRLRWLIPAAAAAAAAVFATLLVVPFDAVSPPGGGPVQRADPSEGIPTFQIVAPREGVTATEPVRFVWHAPAPEASYELTLTDQAGDVVWTSRTLDTLVVLPESVVLGEGRYYWVVDALLDRAQEATTGVHEFRLGN